MGCFNKYDIGGCGCAGCDQTFTVQGCNALPYPSVTVSVYDSTGTTLLTSGATNPSGQVALSWSGTCAVVVTVTGISTRFNAFSQSYTLTAGGTTTLSLTVATGYGCIAGCLIPLSNTVNYTVVGASGTFTGTTTLTANEWVATWREADGATYTNHYNITTSHATQYGYPVSGLAPCGPVQTINLNHCPPSVVVNFNYTIPFNCAVSGGPYTGTVTFTE